MTKLRAFVVWISLLIIASSGSDGINASYDVSTEFMPDAKTAGEYRRAGFGAVVTFKTDGIARGTSALVATGEGKANSVLVKNRVSANYYMGRSRSEAAELAGAIKKNMIANLLITSGNIFHNDCVICENWIQGVPYRFVDLRKKDLRGTYDVTVDTAVYKMVLSGTFDKPVLELYHDTVLLRGATFSTGKDLVSMTFERSQGRYDNMKQ